MILIVKLIGAGLATSNNGFMYSLRGYYDGSKNAPIDGMKYEGYTFNHCSVQRIELRQPLWNPAVDEADPFDLLMTYE